MSKGRGRGRRNGKVALESPISKYGSDPVVKRVLMLPEILGPIIDFAITKSYDKEISLAGSIRRTRIMKTEDTPWPFMLVCKAWHDVALANPALWSSFFAIISSPDFDITHLPSMFNVYLQRSKTTPLTIHVVGDFEYGQEYDDSRLHVETLMIQAFSHQHRWQEICLSFVNDDDEYSSSSADLDSTVNFKEASILKTLDLRISEYFKSNRLTLGSNSLEVLRIHHDAEVVIPSTVTDDGQIYFPNLRVLELALSKQEIRSWTILRASPNIQELTLTFPFDNYGRALPPIMPAFPFFKLRSLIFIAKKHVSELFLDVLDHMDLPAMDTLRIDGLFLNNGRLFRMGALMGRSHLISLKLYIKGVSQPLGERALEAFLSPLTSLEEFSLIFKKGDALGVLKVLLSVLSRGRQREQNRSEILPRLTYFHLHLLPSEILIKDRVSSVLKGVVSTFKQYYSPGFFSISVEYNGVGNGRRDLAIRSLSQDMDLRRCVSDTFTLFVDCRCVERVTVEKGVPRFSEPKQEKKKKRTLVDKILAVL